MSLAGAVRWTLSSRIFTSMVSVGAPGMANSKTSLWFSPSAYATVLGAILIRSSGILAPSFYNILLFTGCRQRAALSHLARSPQTAFAVMGVNVENLNNAMPSPTSDFGTESGSDVVAEPGLGDWRLPVPKYY